jgi:hypothetical protein
MVAVAGFSRTLKGFTCSFLARFHFFLELGQVWAKKFGDFGT